MKNLIIDGGNLLHRTYHSSQKKKYINSDGDDYSHFVTYVQNIKRFVEKFMPDRTYVAWDIRNYKFKNFRQDVVEYKETRDKSKSADIHKFDKLLWYINSTLGLTNIKADKLEADDIIYYLCKKYVADENIIVSTDSDFYQLFDLFSGLCIYNPIKDLVINEHNSIEYNGGVSNENYVLYKSIMGDSSDNIRGIHGYGKVKSGKFVRNFRENYNSLDVDGQEIIKRNIKIISLQYGLKTYPEEAEFYEKQDIMIEPNMELFFEAIDKIGIDEYVDDYTEWEQLFNGGTNLKKDLQLLIEQINN